jgi:hypothetical protein
MPYQTVNPFNGGVLRTFDQQMGQMLANADTTFRERCYLCESLPSAKASSCAAGKTVAGIHLRSRSAWKALLVGSVALKSPGSRSSRRNRKKTKIRQLTKAGA